MPRSKDVLGGLAGGVLATLFVGLQMVLFITVAAPVTREHCLNVEKSEAAQAVVVDTKWAIILWPPPPLDGLDPAGRCVRNTLLREGLAKVGIWSLPAPEEQVRKHVVEQYDES